MEKIIPNLYQQLGDFFTGTFRRSLLYVLTGEVYLGLIILGYKYNFVVSKETLDLVFSSIIQALLSLVALLGVAAFFKLEALRHEEDAIVQIATKDYLDYDWLTNQLIIKQLKEKLISSGEELMISFDFLYNSGERNPTLLFLREKLTGVQRNIKFTRNYIIKFTVLSFFTVLVSLILLIITPILITQNLSIVSLVITCSLVANCLFLVIKGLTDALYY